MSEATLFATIKSMVVNNELKDAIELLENNTTDKRLLNELALQKAKYNEVKHQQINDLISIEQANRERSKIRYALLGLIDRAQQKEPPASNQRLFGGRQTGRLVLLVFVILLGATMAYIFYINKDKSSKDSPTVNEQPIVVDTLEKKEDQPKNTLKNTENSEVQRALTKDSKPKSLNKEPNQESTAAAHESKTEVEAITYPKIKGRVLDQHDNGVKGVRVAVEEVEVWTDQLGRFAIELRAAKGTYSASHPLLLEYMLDSTYYESTDVFIGDDNLVLRIEK